MQLCDTAVLRTEIHTQLLHLASELHVVEDSDTLKGIRSYIMSAWNLIKARQNLGKSFSTTKNEPLNKLVQPIRSFFSTKKKESGQLFK